MWSCRWKGKDGQATGPTGFGGAPLPIELLFFTAQLGDDDRTVELKWATASEADNDFFTLERSANGTDWIPLVEVAGAGNSSQRIDYQERDKQPLFGDSYYRLKQTDYNGDFTYSPAVNVSQNGLTEMEMYPNPVNIGADVILNFPESSKDIIDVNILSMDGKLVHQSTYDISSTHQIILNIGLEFLPGLYLVKTELISAKLVVR